MPDAIEELEAILAEVDREARQRREQLQILQQEKIGLQAALRRLRERQMRERNNAPDQLQNPKVQKFISGVIETIDTMNAGRADQIMAILDRAGGALTLAEIEEVANRTAGHWTPDQIRNAVASLHKKHQVQKVRRGVWISTKTSAESAGTDSAETVPTTRPEGGSQGVEPPTSVLPQDHDPFGGREASDSDRETGDRYVVQT